MEPDACGRSYAAARFRAWTRFDEHERVVSDMPSVWQCVAHMYGTEWRGSCDHSDDTVSQWAIHSHQGSIHLEACILCNGDMQELRIRTHDCAFCVSALRHTCISMDAGCWAACCMLYAAELRSDARCASKRKRTGDSAPLRRPAGVQTSTEHTARHMPP